MSKKNRFIAAFAAAVLIVMAFFIPIETRQAVDYQLRVYRIPLYIKIIEFIDRDYQYRRIVREITEGKTSDEEKVLAIFNWSVANIRHKPEGMPIVDDHPLNIIIRGYGVSDQFEDIFTILCTYAGFEAFYREFSNPDKGHYILSLVRIGHRWYPFSVARNVHVVSAGRLASIDDMFKDPALVSQLSSRIPSIKKDSFLQEMRKTEFKATSVRVKGQSPLGRIACYLKNLH